MKHLVVLVLFFGLGFTVNVFAQGERQSIRFSGLVVQGDSSQPVVGAHVYLSGAGKGTITNPYGYFAMTVREGDVVRISAVGYQPYEVKIPKRNDPLYSILIDMKMDTTVLEEITIYPYPNEEAFKEAFLAMNTLTVEEENLQRNLDPDRIREYAYKMPAGPTANFQYTMSKQINQITNKFMVPTTQYLNPVAWAKFIKDLKSGRYKKKRKK